MRRLLLACALLWPASASAQMVQQSILRPLTYHSVTFGALAEVTSASWTFGPQSFIARVICTVSCTVAFPVNKSLTASTSPAVLGANEREYFKITPGSWVQVRSNGLSGSIHVTEME